MDVKLVRILLPLLLVAMLCNPSFGTTITVKAGGGANYTTIGQALAAADALPPYDPCEPGGSTDQVTILVQDSANYAMSATAAAPGLLFPADQNNLVLAADVNCAPIITLSGIQPYTNYIRMRSAGQVIRGFTIKLTQADPGALDGSVDSNSVCISATGGGTTVQDCIIQGPCWDPLTPTSGPDPHGGYVAGIRAVANITSCEISGFRVGILCDLNDVKGVGFNYAITNCNIHDNHKRGVQLGSCDANMIHTNVRRCGNTIATPSGIGIDNCGNVICDGNETGTNKARINITDCNILTSYSGRSLNVETTGVVNITNSRLISNFTSTDSAGTRFDVILQYGGTLNLTGCLIDGSHGALAGLNCNQGTSGEIVYTGGTANLDHCTILDDPVDTQWGIYTLAPDAVINVKNSIFSGANGSSRNAYGLYQGGNGTINTSYNNVFCTSAYASQGPTRGTGDLLNTNPQWIQVTDDSNAVTYYVIQPYSPVVTAGEGGTYMGWKNFVRGFERWPADFTYLLHNTFKGVNFRDFAIFASEMGDDGRYVVEPNVLVATDGTATAEAFVDTGTVGQVPDGSGNPYVLGPRSTDSNNIWRVVTWASGGVGYQTGTQNWHRATSLGGYGSSLTLYTGSGTPNDANSGLGGTKNVRWNYALTPHPVGNGDPCYAVYTEVMYTLPHGIDFHKHNSLRVMMKRAAGNTPTETAFMYARFLNVGRGSNKTIPDKGDIARTIIGGDPATRPGEWYAWQINMNFDPTSGWNSGFTYDWDWQRIGAVLFGVRTQDTDPYDLDGVGQIDIDTIQLSQRGCDATQQPDADLNDDCMVNFTDVDQFAYYWMMGE